MIRAFILFSLLCCSLSLSAQIGISTGKGAKGLALGSGITAITGIEAAYSNPAGLVFVEDLAFQLSSERRFEISDFIIATAAFNKRISNFGNLGLLISNYSLESYQETKFALSYSRRLTDKLSIGASADYIQTRIEEFGSKGTFSFEVGVLSQITKDFRLGVHVFSPSQVSVTTNTTLKTTFSAGLAYAPSKKVSIYADFSKSIDIDPRVHVGIDYQLTDRIAVQLGTATNPSNVGIGVQFGLGKFRVNGAASYHEFLGTTPAVSLAYDK